MQQLASSGRIVFVMQWVLALLLPLFVFLGRGIVGAQLGWTAVIGAGFSAVMTLLLAVPAVLALFDRVARTARSVRTGYAVATALVWLGLVVVGLSIPDADDDGTLPSALSAWFGTPYEGSVVVFGVASAIAMVAWIGCIVLAIRGIVASRRGD